MTSSGVFPHDCIGIYKILHTLGLILSWEPASIAVGGTHAITHALQRAFSSMGGEFVVETPVERAIIENGKAVGVKLADGREIAARKVVVSDLNTPQTVLQLIGEEHVPRKIAHRAKNVLFNRAQLFWGNFALHELPAYTAAKENPEIGMAPGSTGAPRIADYFATRHQAELFVKGIPEKLVCIVAPDSIWDRTRAPEGKHTILIEQFTAPYRFFSDREWLRMKRDIVKIMLEAVVLVCPEHDRRQPYRGSHHHAYGHANAKHQHAPGRLEHGGHDRFADGAHEAVSGASPLPSSRAESVSCLCGSAFGAGNRQRAAVITASR